MLSSLALAMVAKERQRLDAERARQLPSQTEVILFDCDGVLWRGEAALPGAAETLHHLETVGVKHLCYVTNNSSRTCQAYTETLQRLGFLAAEPGQGSAYCAARHLRCALPPGGAAYMLGGLALSAELEALAITHLGVGPTPEPGSAYFGTGAPLDPSMHAVLVGYDKQHLRHPVLGNRRGGTEDPDTRVRRLNIKEPVVV